MPSQSLSIVPQEVSLSCISEIANNVTNFPVAVPGLSLPAKTLTKNQLISVTFTPTAVYSSFNPATYAQLAVSNFAGVFFMEGFGMAVGHTVVLTAAKRSGATGNLLDNTIIMLAGGTEIARIRVDAATQTAGLVLSAQTPANGDTRVTLADVAGAITGGAITAASDLYTKSAHGLQTGDPVILTAITNGAGLTQGNLYFFHRLSSSTGYLCASYANAIAGTQIDVTTDGSSVTLTKQRSLGFVLDQVDPNLSVEARILGSDQ